MKKSLNNRLRGKRLVTGDENEVTSNEILIEDKDGKIAVKQRGAEGKMEDIAEGKSTGFSLEYYIYGSLIRTNRGSGYKLVKTIKNADLAELAKIPSTLKELESEKVNSHNAIYCYAIADHFTDATINHNSKNIVATDAYGNTITLNTNRSITITVNRPSVKSLLQFKCGNSSNRGYNSIADDGDLKSPAASSSGRVTIDNAGYIEYLSDIQYDVANNILYYFATCSSSNYVSIYPKSLADTIKVYGNFYKVTYSDKNSYNYLNGKLIEYEKVL